MYFVFADDSKQQDPSREGMGPLVAYGGMLVPLESVAALERDLALLCVETGFPDEEEFKWSPRKKQWMHKGLSGDGRRDFLISALELARQKNAASIVVVEDSKCSTATGLRSHEDDCFTLFLERVECFCAKKSTQYLIISDRPGGHHKEEDQFMSRCRIIRERGTKYVEVKNMLLDVLTCASRFLRVLQLADVVTSCTLSRVAGEAKHSVSVFPSVKRLFDEELGRIGGVGLKIHPDFKYANLYHWLLGDEHLVRFPIGYPLPLENHPYSTNEGKY